MSEKLEDTITKETVNMSALARSAWSKVVYMRYIMAEMAQYLQTCPTKWTLKEVITSLRERARTEPDELHRDVLYCKISAYERALEDLFRDSSGNPELSLQITVGDLLRQITDRLFASGGKHDC